MRPIHVLAAGIVVSLAITGCASDPSSSPPAASKTPATQSSQAPSQPRIAAKSDLVPEGLTVAMPQGWRDTSTPTIQHFLAPDVSADPLAERWGDILIYEATSVIDPTTGQQQPLPDNVAGWLRANPSVEVLDERTIPVDGRSATVIDAGRPTGGVVFNGGAVEFDSGVGMHERYILIPVGQRWIVVQASTFRGPEGLAEPDGPTDALVSVLESIEIAEP
jgi:hypothetical protein